MAATSLFALIPAYNEATRIGPVIQTARLHLPVLVVDDGSRDDTAGVAEAAGATVLRQRPNQGKGAALRAGLRWGLERGYDATLLVAAVTRDEVWQPPERTSTRKYAVGPSSPSSGATTSA